MKNQLQTDYLLSLLLLLSLFLLLLLFIIIIIVIIIIIIIYFIVIRKKFFLSHIYKNRLFVAIVKSLSSIPSNSSLSTAT